MTARCYFRELQHGPAQVITSAALLARTAAVSRSRRLSAEHVRRSLGAKFCRRAVLITTHAERLLRSVPSQGLDNLQFHVAACNRCSVTTCPCPSVRNLETKTVSRGSNANEDSLALRQFGLERDPNVCGNREPPPENLSSEAMNSAFATRCQGVLKTQANLSCLHQCSSLRR